MQAVGGACSLGDDMLDGDLGDGTGVRSARRTGRMKSQSFSGSSEAPPTVEDRQQFDVKAGRSSWRPGLRSTETLQRARRNLQEQGSLSGLSKEELSKCLQDANEVIDGLCCELEVAHQYLEGKYKALKILEGKAILDKATCHTKSVLQKTEDKAKALEKEVNSLQWEISFSQAQMRKSQQSWEQQFSRILSENESLSHSLQERESEVQQLRTENSALSRQCLELLSLLSVKEQRAYSETKPQYSPDRDAGILELAVLGACRCVGGADVCPCSRTAAASRKQLIQLQQELESQRCRREEAMMVADAFRIAFEQQLRKRSEHFLLLAEANVLKSHPCRAEASNRSPLLNVSKKLRGLLPSGVDVKVSDEEAVYRLLDLLNDKEEALAHQRKVSIMLAHNAEELQRQLQQGLHCHTTEPPQCKTPSEYRVPSESTTPSESTIPSEYRVPSEFTTPSETTIPSESIALSASGILPQPRFPSQSRMTSKNLGFMPSLLDHKSQMPKTPPSDPLESRISSKPSDGSLFPVHEDPEIPESHIQPGQPQIQPEFRSDPDPTQTKSKLQPVLAESYIKPLSNHKNDNYHEKPGSEVQSGQPSSSSGSRGDQQELSDQIQTTTKIVPNHGDDSLVHQMNSSISKIRVAKDSNHQIQFKNKTDPSRPESLLQAGQSPGLFESCTEPQKFPDRPQTTTEPYPDHRVSDSVPQQMEPSGETQKAQENQNQGHESDLHVQNPTESTNQIQLWVHLSQQPSPSESRTDSDPQRSKPPTQPQASAESHSQSQSNHRNHKSNSEDSSQSRVPSRSPRPLGTQSQTVTTKSKTQDGSESNMLEQQNQQGFPGSLVQSGQPPHPSESRTNQTQTTIRQTLNHKRQSAAYQSAPSESRCLSMQPQGKIMTKSKSKIQLISTKHKTQLKSNHMNKSETHRRDPSESTVPAKQVQGPFKDQILIHQTSDTPESKNHSQDPTRSLCRVQHPNAAATRTTRVPTSAKTTTKSVRVQD